MRVRILLSFLLIAACAPAWALDFTFSPEISSGDAGQTVLISGQIGESVAMRGFTIYMAYDTNVIDLAEPPVAGSLVATQEGLQFNYFDHAPFEPDLLEIGATIFGTDFWQGPGELFQVRFTLRQCGVETIDAPFEPFFVAADGSYPTVVFHAGTVMICSGMPSVPEALTVYPQNGQGARLQWSAVRLNIFGQPLPAAPGYRIYRQQTQPSLLPPEVIATVTDTVYLDSYSTGLAYLYTVTAQTNP